MSEAGSRTPPISDKYGPRSSRHRLLTPADDERPGRKRVSSADRRQSRAKRARVVSPRDGDQSYNGTRRSRSKSRSPTYDRRRSRRSPAKTQRESRSRSRTSRRSKRSSKRSESRHKNGSDSEKLLLEVVQKLCKSKSQERYNSVNVVPEFDPSSKSQNVDIWISKVNEIGKMYNWKDNQIVHYAISKLVGNAKRWYEGLTTVNFTWTEWQLKLKSAFPSNENYGQMLSEMLEKRARFGESLEDYFYEKTALLNRCDIVGKRAVDCIIFGIEDRAVRLGAEAAQFSEPDKLLAYLRNIKIRKTEGAVKPVPKRVYPARDGKPSNSIGSNSSRGPIRCYNCKEEGHIISKCTKPIKKCTNCSLPGHEATECFRKVKEETKPVLEISNTESSHNRKYVQDVIINGHGRKGYVDLGSDCTLVRESDALQILGQWEQSNCITMAGFGGACVKSLGSKEVDCEIQGVKATLTVHIVSDVHLKYPVLVGQTFTELPHVNIMKTDDVLLVTENMNGQNVIKLYVANDTSIKSGCGFVEVYSKCDYDGSMLVSGGFRTKPSEYSIEEGVFYLQKGTGILLVDNLGSEDVHFTKDELLTRVQKIKVFNLTTPKINRIKEKDLPMFSLSDLNVGDQITEEQKLLLLGLVNAYRHCFATSLGELGRTSVEKMKIGLSDPQPIVYRPYRLSHSEREEVRKMVGELLEYGIVRESCSPFASPIILVRKKTGEQHLCVDYRALNRKTVRQHYPLPRIEDQMDRLSGYNLYTSLDLASGYYQIELEEGSKEKTAFVTPDGQFEFNRMPFGLTNAPAVFQRTINKVLDTLRHDSVVVYMDDVLLPSVSFSDGIDKLKQVLNKISEAGLTLKMTKCMFFSNQIDFLGFEVSGQGIRPGQNKIHAVENFPTPKNIHNVRQFLGLASFFRRFVKNFALMSRPLSKLLKNNTPWSWGPEQVKAFTDLKVNLVSRPILALYNPKAETELHTDASKFGIGGILMQRQPDKSLKPVAYYSKQTSPDEQHFSAYELETLAVVSSLIKFRPYLIGIRFTVVTDCNSLRATLTKRDMIPRVARWWSLIQEFDFEMAYKPGTAMSHVDALSRNPVNVTNGQGIEDFDKSYVMHISADWLMTVQMGDDESQRIKRILEDEESDRIVQVKENYCLKRGLIYRKTDGGLRWLVPRGVRWQVLRTCHDDIGHFSYDKTLDKVKADYWFPRMGKFIKKYCQSCLECAHGKLPSGKKSGFLHPIEKVPKPFHTLHADHLGPFNASKKKNKYVLAIIEAFTKFIVLKAVKNTKTSTTLTVFKDYFALFGVPERLITDRGSTFTSTKFKEFLAEKGVKHVLNSVATPRANGQVERFNRTVLDALSASTRGKDEKLWDEALVDVQWGLNNTLNKTTGKTPAELLFGLRLTGSTESELKLSIGLDDEDVSSKDLNQVRLDALDKINGAQEKQKEHFDKSRCPPRQYQEGQLVRVERDVAQEGSKKLVQKCFGPYRISKVLPNDRYEVEDTPITKKKGKAGYKGVHSVDKIWPWLSFQSPASETESSTSASDDE